MYGETFTELTFKINSGKSSRYEKLFFLFLDKVFIRQTHSYQDSEI